MDLENHWFGPFEHYGKDDDLTRQTIVQWPNLGLLLAEAKEALAEQSRPAQTYDMPGIPSEVAVSRPVNVLDVIRSRPMELRPMSTFPFDTYDI